MSDSASDSRQGRLARNEHIFRTVNDNIADAADGHEPSHSYEFLCECSNVRCAERIEMTLEDHTLLRSRGDRFALVAEHDDPTVEKVVERTVGYWVVEKTERAGEVARELWAPAPPAE